MDAGVTHTNDSWFLQWSEQALRAFAMGLVLTGQMLPTGAVSAQDDPPSPSFSAPPASAELTPVAVEVQPPAVVEEAVPPTEVEESSEAPRATEPSGEEAADETLPPATENEAAPATDEAPHAEEGSMTEEAPATQAESAEEPAPMAEEAQPASAVPETPAAEAANETPDAPAAEPTPTTEEAPAPTLPEVRDAATNRDAAAVESSDPTKYQIGEWTMTIRPGPVPLKVIREYHTPVAYEGYPANQNNVSVPVNVNVNNLASQNWPWASPWSTPWANLNYWNSPTAAYLFQHPQPYWQLRQDFYHLRPFIRGL